MQWHCAVLPRKKGAVCRSGSRGINVKAGLSGEVSPLSRERRMLPGAAASRWWDSWRKLWGRFGWTMCSITMVTLNRQIDVESGGYFKAGCKDGLATQFLSCSLWHAPPTCFLCSLYNSQLYIQIFCTCCRLIQPIFLPLAMVKVAPHSQDLPFPIRIDFAMLTMPIWLCGTLFY